MSTDPKANRRYQAGIERALGLFDASNEWADYIAFLSRLAKALQASPPGADVPFKSTLAKYLALCLKPSLPSGVHQKALEVYNLVFTLLGKDRLSGDLSVWLPGFSHTLTFASLTTRPLFLSLYDDHLLKLPSGVLRPPLRAIILSLLPGIEEENSEDFDRTLNTFNRLRQIFVEDDAEEFFWQSLFLASITSVSKRPGALVYLTRQLPMLGPNKAQQLGQRETGEQESEADGLDIKAVTTPEPGLLVRCFATGLQDQQPLVQRGFLDLLVSHLPLNSPILHSHVSANDLDVLVSAAMSVVLRRDMSLNRRLWTWFIGREDKREGSTDMTPGSAVEPTTVTAQVKTGSSRQEFFARYGLDSVTRSLERMLSKQSLSPVNRARPFRIMLSLMDRWIIGKLPVEALFITAMQDLQRYQTTAPSQASFDEVFRSANGFFDAIEPQLVTSQLLQLLAKRDFNLIEFIMSNFNLQEEEMMTVHLPMLCLATSEVLLEDSSSKESSDRQKSDDAMDTQLVKILEGLSSLLPAHPAGASPESLDDILNERWTTKIRAIYESSSKAKMSLLDTISPGTAAQLLLRNVTLIFLDCIDPQQRRLPLGSLANVFTKAISRTDTLQTLQAVDFGNRLHTALSITYTDTATGYDVAKTVARLVDTLHVFDPRRETLTEHHLLRLVPQLISHFWDVLLPRTPQFHVEAVEQIWSLRTISGSLLLVDSKIMALMCENPNIPGHVADQMARFSTLWMHTRFPEINAELFSAAQRIDEDEVPWAMLRQPVLRIIDGIEPSQLDDPRRMWLINLSSILPIFRIAHSEYASASDSQHSLLGLYRLEKVVTIARQASAQRNELFGSNGFSGMLLDMCVDVIASASNAKGTAKVTLSILRVVIEETDIRGAHTLINLLMQQLVDATKDSSFQENILDTLQTIFAKPNRGPPPNELMAVLMAGISSKAIDSTIDKWITLLCNTIPLYSTKNLFANMLKLTSCFCQRTQAYFELMKQLYGSPTPNSVDGEKAAAIAKNPERSVNNLLAGLEYTLARAHTHLADQSIGKDPSNPSPADISQSRSIANNRLTVVLCMQDTIKLCGEIWAWRILKRPSSAVPDGKSFAYMSSKLRTRTRRILEHLADAEPQECLETLMGMWVDAARQDSEYDVVLNLMQSLDGARPKFMMPATFNAVYNRTNPSALDPAQKSSLSVNVTASELMAFLIAYTKALEDDLLEEIWTDCTAFLREILANPMPHRQILLKLLQFVAVLCQKMENTNFGEVSKMRRELGDLCSRLFTAIFTIRPTGLDSTSQRSSEAKTMSETVPVQRKSQLQTGNALGILCETLPTIGSALGDLDRLNSTLSGIALHITGPALRSRQFPQTAGLDILRLVHLMGKSQPNNKTWKKDVLDAFNDAKFFQSSASLAEAGWLPLLRQLWLSDKGFMGELLSRLTPPTTAGLMFGVGATAARTEADRRTQLTLRRIALLLMAGELDAFVADLEQIMRKLEELLTATASSSPSSSTRAEIYIVMRAIVLAFAQTQLVSIWPIVDGELRELFTSLQKDEEATFTGSSQLQGAKLLDLLLLLKPEEFQLHEWLFVTDTVDAVYPPHDFKSAAIADLMVSKGEKDMELPSVSDGDARKPWLCTDATRSGEEPQPLLRPFFRQLSIHAFEDTYSLQAVDLDACRQDLLADLFVD